jgi:O-antigen ligase
VEGLFGASPNNVLDIDKAGGVFVNGNVASMFMGASAMALLGVWAYQKKRWALAVAIVAFMGTVATGSKTGLGLTILLPLGSVAVYHALRLKVGMVPVAFAIGLLGCAFEYLRGSSVSTGSLVSSSVSTIEVRNKIWYAAWELFLRHPIAGLGLGGWEQQMPYWRSRLGLPLDYPPHNYIIYSWAQLGLLGAVLVVAFVVTVGVVAQRAVSMSSNDPAALAGAIFFSGAMVWVLLHGMGDNTTIYGDQRSMVLVGAVLAQLALPWQRCHGRTEQGVPSAERAMEPLPAAGVNNGV